jgi:hypothetical protein
MKKFIALCTLILLSTAAAAFALPLFQEARAFSGAGLLDRILTFPLQLTSDREPLAPTPGTIAPLDPLPATDSAAATFFAGTEGSQGLRRPQGWPAPLSLNRPGEAGGVRPAPEPATLFLLGTGLIALAGIARRGFRF